MPTIPDMVLQTPYCRFAKESSKKQLENAVRWQYYFDKKRAFDSTLPGWHSFGPQESNVLEQSFKQGNSSAKFRSTSTGYDYEADLTQMTQTNISTKKARTIRRLEVAFRRVVVDGGKSFSLEADLVPEEVVEWIYEVVGEHKLDFHVVFEPAVGEEEATDVLNTTRSANAWSFKAPVAGRISLKWSSYFKMATSRAVLVDWRRKLPEQLQDFIFQPEGRKSTSSSTLSP